MLLKEIITDLCGLPAPSGFEEKAFERTKELLSPYVDEIKTDALGNLIAIKRCGKDGAKKLLFDAHMDEIGLIVTGIEKGFLRFANLGGIDPRMLPAREIKVLTTPPIFGVIDTMPPHALSEEDMDKTIDPKRLFIDIGMNEEEAKKRVPLGTPAVFAGGVDELNENVLCGKSLDDRSCVAIIIKTMEQLFEKALNVDICCLFSTQEELGTRGAITGAYGVQPDYAIALDVTFASTPDSKKGEVLEMRKGAAIGVGPGMNRNITNMLIKTAEEKAIPYQLEIMGGDSGTNGWVIQVCREGVVTGVVSLPIRYMHSPVETMDITDAEAIVTLLTEFTRKLSNDGIA
ncbi:MAG: M42 family peptidase [Oscillospiraceae bacterium]|nr:M42 family peptidase [Oscillospiraceae bacterium]